MVNGINSNNHINSYTNNSVRSSKTDTDAPAFLLQYDEKGVVWEHDDRKKKSEKQKNERDQKTAVKANALNAGSISGEEVSAKNKNLSSDGSVTQKAEDRTGVKLFRSFIDNVKKIFFDIFNFIWYGEDKKETIQEQTEEETVSSAAVSEENAGRKEAADPAEMDAVIKDLIARHDTEGVVDILTKNHTIHPARNSTLLTYYDRHGRIVDHSRTNTGRILHGDRNTRIM